jgi:UDP-N-acetylglucosamine:LPS N-acetylglucosamine transferase
VTVYLMAGGGTAGHVNPLLATADRLREREPDAEVLVLGTSEGLEARLVPARGYELVTIPRLPFPRRPNADALRFPSRWKASVERTREILRERAVDAVVGFGGYAAAPAYTAAHKEHLPLVIHEANARPATRRTSPRCSLARASVTGRSSACRCATRSNGSTASPRARTRSRRSSWRRVVRRCS